MPAVKTAATKPKTTAKKAPKPSAAKPTPAAKKHTDALLKRALKIRQSGKSWPEVAAAVDLKASSYLAKKMTERFGADAVRIDRKPAEQAPAPAETKPTRKRTVKPKASAS